LSSDRSHIIFKSIDKELVENIKIALLLKNKIGRSARGGEKIKNILVDKEGLDINNITITSCDADARINPGYFSALTYNFTTDKNRYLRFWQSPICWHNNFWKVPAFIRIIGTLSNVGYLANIQEPDGLF